MRDVYVWAIMALQGVGMLDLFRMKSSSFRISPAAVLKNIALTQADLSEAGYEPSVRAR